MGIAQINDWFIIPLNAKPVADRIRAIPGIACLTNPISENQLTSTDVRASLTKRGPG